MHAIQRQQFDGDQESVVAITDYVTDQNRHEIYCRSCNKTLYADSDTFKAYNHAIEQGLDAPYICVECGLDEAEAGSER